MSFRIFQDLLPCIAFTASAALGLSPDLVAAVHWASQAQEAAAVTRAPREYRPITVSLYSGALLNPLGTVTSPSMASTAARTFSGFTTDSGIALSHVVTSTCFSLASRSR